MPSDDLETILNPADQQDDMTRWLRDQHSYVAAKRLEDGSYAVLIRLLYTLAIGLGVDHVSIQRRFCYEDTGECIHQWLHLRSRHDEPTGWIARRPE